MSLENFVVVITGGAGGLGKALAASFLEANSKVAICDVNEERLATVSSEWTSAYPEKTLVTKTDITSEESVSIFFAKVIDTFGRIDMLINNAGIMDKFDPVGTLSKHTFDMVMSVNVTGTFLCTKAAVNAMQTQTPNGGTIINISSIAGTRGTNAGAAYTASKHAVLGLTKNTASFYGDKGIYCLALAMGGMDTNITDAFATGINMEGMALMQTVNPGFVADKTAVPLADVAKYCKFFANRSIAAASNGSTVTVNRNWPMV